MKLHSKTMSRIAAIQALYQYEFSSHQENTQQLIEKIHSYYKDRDSIEDISESSLNMKIAMHSAYFVELVNTTINNMSLIDDTITACLIAEWKIQSLPILLLSILRIAVCELKFFPEVPNKVSINEFTDIASSMLDEKEISFVNSILDNIAKKSNHGSS